MRLFKRHLFNIARADSGGSLVARVEAPNAKQALLTYTVRSGFPGRAMEGFGSLGGGNGRAWIAGNEFVARRADTDTTSYSDPPG